MQNKYLIRAEADEKIGAGHVMRMIALGQMLKDCNQEVHFLTRTQNNNLLDRIFQECFVLHKVQNKKGAKQDAEGLLKVAGKIKAKWVILDGYNFMTEYQRMIKKEGFSLMCIDDIAQCHFLADVVLNQNIKASSHIYSAEEYTRFFIGPKHVLLRREFLKAKSGFSRSCPKKTKKILVTMGGADPNNITQKVLEVLNQLENNELQIKVVVGDLNLHYESIEKFANSARICIEVCCNVGLRMPELMKWADLGISAAGSTILEAQYLGLPLLCCQLVPNQKINYVFPGLNNRDFYEPIFSMLNTIKEFFIVQELDVSCFNVRSIIHE